MSTYRETPTRTDRAQAIAAVAAVHVALAGLALSQKPVIPRVADQPRTTIFDVALPPPPPPPPDPGAARDDPGAAGKKAEPAPIVAPPPRIALPVVTPLPAAPVAGNASASTAGAAISGGGTGAGGAGTGTGAGGNGSGTIGSEARLLSGGLSRADYRRLRAFDAPAGRARLALTVGRSGQVERCTIADSSGDPALDSALCDILKPRMRWAAARDSAGNPISVGLNYVATWQRF